MCTTAFSSAKAISVFAADELYYGVNPNYGSTFPSTPSRQGTNMTLTEILSALQATPSSP
jgi:hypothetical protein